MINLTRLLTAAVLTFACGCLHATTALNQETDTTKTLHPQLQKLGQRLLAGKTGSIVAIDPATGEILCLATNSDHGSDVKLAIGKPYAPVIIINTH